MTSFMKLKLLTLAPALALTAIVLTIATAGLLSPQATPAGGTISHSVGVEIFNEENTASTCTSIDWGDLNPQSRTTRTIYVKNTGNTTETLNLEVTDWNPPEATSMLALTWDKEGTSLRPEQVVAATLVLTMGEDSGTVDNFYFNVIITGSA
jgi:hypothetical protein